MEDVVAIHPRFCRTNRDNDNELHYFAVYEGHGCSQDASLVEELRNSAEEGRLGVFGGGRRSSMIAVAVCVKIKHRLKISAVDGELVRFGNGMWRGGAVHVVCADDDVKTFPVLEGRYSESASGDLQSSDMGEKQGVVR
nr:probable protein phosphatase 2C 24 [Ipomoea batatas]